VSATFNGGKLRGATAVKKNRITFALKPEQVKKGMNRVIVTLDNAGRTTRVLTDLQLWIKYKK